MKLLGLVLLFGAMFSYAPAQSAERKIINVAFTHGKPDYIDLSDTGAQVHAAILPHPSQAKNFESFAIHYRAWSWGTDFTFHPKFFYEINRRVLTGKTREVSFHRIQKYPSLVKRYLAIRPTSVNFRIHLYFEALPRFHPRPLQFKVADVNLGYNESRSSKNESTPSTLLEWKSSVSMESGPGAFTDRDRSDLEVLKEHIKNYNRYYPLAERGPNVTLDVKWPEEAIDRIALDYERYEREGRELAADLNELKEEPKLTKKVDPNAADGDMSKPFESAIKSAEPFESNGVVGLRLKGKTVFESREHYIPFKLDDAGSLFSIRLKNAVQFSSSVQVINAAGKALSVDGHSKFISVFKGPKPGTYLVMVDNNGSEVFTTTKHYYMNVAGPYTQSVFDKLRQYDQTPSPPRKPGGGISFDASRYRMTFKTGVRYLVDSKFRVLSSETMYYKSRQTETRVGEIINKGDFNP